MSTESHQPNRNSPPDEAAIYQQDCEFYRYQDHLMWGRFQTAATVEGGLLYALYGLGKPIPQPDRFVLQLAGDGLVLLICILSLKDASDAGRHLSRLRKFEGNTLPSGSFPGGMGVKMMLVAIILINVANAVLFCLSLR